MIVYWLLGVDDTGPRDIAQTSVIVQTSITANNNDGDVDSVVNNNDCTSPSSCSKLSPFLMSAINMFGIRELL